MGLKAYLEKIEPDFEPVVNMKSGMRFTKL